jgi:hypothetical protein
MKNFADDSIGNFESPADPAHAPGLNESGATNEGIGRESDPRGSREVGARGHEADASDAADAARGSGEEETGEEIEITEEMIEAGEEIIYGKLGSGLPSFLSGADLAVMVYSAMASVNSAKRSPNPEHSQTTI